jgi:glycosyltransferase involved in cell wall biosynthesis
MLQPMGKLKVLIRRHKRAPQNLNIDLDTDYVGLDSRINEYLSIASYLLLILAQISMKRVLGLVSTNDIIYTNFEYSGLVGLWGKRVLGMQWVADFFDDPRRGYLNASTRLAPRWRVALEEGFLRLYRRFLRCADLVVCNAYDQDQGLAALLVREFAVGRDRLVTVPAGVCEEYIASCLSDASVEEKALELMRENNLDGKDYLYLVGSINSDISGVGSLLGALGRLHAEGLDLHLVLAGLCKPLERVWLAASIEKMNLNPHVHYLGEIDQRLSYSFMRKARACICAYDVRGRQDYETAYPIKLLEYLTVGAPTVTVETSVTRQLVKEFGSGELVPAASEKAMASAIKSVVTHPSGGVSVKVPARYRWDHINKTLQAHLFRVINADQT